MLAHMTTFQMDWIGDRLTQLIEEGKRALGTEVVVASETPEDEMDDGSGDWVEDDEMSRSSLYSPSKRFRHQNSYSVPSASTPRRTYNIHQHFASEDLSTSTLAMSTTPVASTRYAGEQSLSSSSSSYDQETDWSSPHLKESMERARAAYRQRHGL